MAKSSSRPLAKPKVRARIRAWCVEGKSSREIVELLKAELRISVTPQAVQGYIRRHRAEIDALVGRVVEAVEEVTIKDKSERIRRLAGLYDRMDEIVTTRGLLAREPKVIGSGRDAYEVEVERFDAALVRELRGVLGDVADELGDRPKTPLIDARTLNISLDALAEIKRRALDAGE